MTNEQRLSSAGDSADGQVSDSPRVPLPEGTIPVAIGLVISGVASYAFFKVGQQALGKEDFKPIVALWFTTFALVPGFFMPVEQEVGRALAHRRALNQGGRPVVQKVLPLMLGMMALLMIVVIAASGWITNDLFEGYGLVTFALVFAFMSYAPFHLARGICSGSGRFPPYGLLMGLDGITRTAGCIILWLAGVDVIGAYALVVVLAPLVGIAVVLSMGSLRTDDGPPAEFSEITPNLGWLLGGSILAAALVNAGPLGIDILASADEAAKVTAFGNGVLLSRVPLFLFQAVQAALLPRLARLAAKGDLGEFRTGFRHLMVVVVGVAVVGTVGSFLVGPPVLEYVYDGGLDRRTLTLLALASGLYMIALATSQAVIALQGHSFVTYGWAAGMATFLLVTAYSSDDLYLRVELGLVTASTAALIVFAFGLRQRVTAGATPDAESMIDGILDNPLEA